MYGTFLPSVSLSERVVYLSSVILNEVKDLAIVIPTEVRVFEDEVEGSALSTGCSIKGGDPSTSALEYRRLRSG